MRTWPGALAVLLIGCGEATVAPPPSALAVPARPATEPAEPCSLTLRATAGSEGSPARLPPDLYARALAPVVAALCACPPPEDRTRIRAQVLAERGEVRATAPEEPRVDACLAGQLKPGRFTAFDVPPGVQRGAPSTAHLAPARPGPVEQFRAKVRGDTSRPRTNDASPAPAPLVYALTFDRKENELRDATGPRTPDFDDR
jgi:hypothetical protein